EGARLMESGTRRDFLRASAAAGLSVTMGGAALPDEVGKSADLILTNGRIATQDQRRTFAAAAAIRGDKLIMVGDDKDVMPHKGERTRVIDLGKRTVIPGLNDS